MRCETLKLYVDGSSPVYRTSELVGF